MNKQAKENNPVFFALIIVAMIALIITVVVLLSRQEQNQITDLGNQLTTNNEQQATIDNQSLNSEPSADQPASAGSEISQTDQQNPNEQSVVNSTLVGEYLDYSQAQFAQNSNRQRWLYFHADWCAKCKALDKSITENTGSIPADVVIFKVDYDQNQDLRKEYQVRVQTTVVQVDDQGKGQKSFIGQSYDHTLDDLVKYFSN